MSTEPALSSPAARASAEAYASRLSAAKALLAQLDARAARLANLRGVVFLSAVGLAVARIFEKLPGWAWLAALGCLALYAALARIHAGVISREERERLRVRLNERGLARLSEGWHRFPETGERFANAEHLYTPDLDVFGQGSLFQLMGETATVAGEERLASWLSAGAAAAGCEELRARQACAKELTPLVDFRQGLLVETGLVSKTRADPRRFIAWAEGGPYLGSARWARPLAVLLPLATLALYVLGRLQLVPRPLFWAGLFLQLGVTLLTRKALTAFYDAIVAGEHGFVRFEETFARIEAQPFTHPKLQAMAGQLRAQGVRTVSQSLRRFSFDFGFAELRQSGQFYAVIQLLTLWDLHFLFRLEAWRREHGSRVRGWFEALAELEALCALATLAHDRPHFQYPELVEEGPLFVAQGLGHPLLLAPVVNDVELPSGGHALLLTGSNMSGKTTLLRAIGANAVLALCGAPVCASALRVSRVQLLTSMRVKDSLERGVSYFYAEVQRIKKVLDAAVAVKGQALFLLDEILLGTNTRERQIASRELLRQLLRTGACGGVTTHDLSLTQLALEAGRGLHVRNMHFRDQLVDGQMAFDYRLREGVVDTTNALRVLEQAGIHLSPEALAADAS